MKQQGYSFSWSIDSSPHLYQKSSKCYERHKTNQLMKQAIENFKYQEVSTTSKGFCHGGKRSFAG